MADDADDSETSEGEAGSDPVEVPEPAPQREVLPPVGGVRRRTVGGAMLAAAMIGVQEVLEGPKDDPIVLEIGSGAEGDDDDALAVDLDPYDPSSSVAVVRPWLHDA